MHLAMMGVSDVNEVARRIDVYDPNNEMPNLTPSNYLDEQIETDSIEFNELRKKIRSLATNLSPKSKGRQVKKTPNRLCRMSLGQLLSWTRAGKFTKNFGVKHLAQKAWVGRG